MRNAIERLKFPVGALGGGGAQKHTSRRYRGAQSGQPTGHGPRMPQATEDTVDASQADRWEKLRQVERGDHGLAGMDLGTGETGAAGDKAVRAAMHRDDG